MTRLSTKSPPLPSRSRTSHIGLCLAAALLLALPVLSTSRTRGPSFVPRVSIVNPTTYQLAVEVGTPGRTGALGLGAIGREGSRDLEEVIDQGDSWVFRFSYGGTDGGELTVSRAQLEQEGWRVTVPRDVGERLRAAGLAPSY